MWGLIIAAGIEGGLYLYNRLTAPKTPAPVPRTRESLDLPRTEEGTAIPLVYGRCQVKSPVMTWCSELNSLQGPDDKWITYGLHMLFVVGIPMGNGTTRSNQLNGPLLHNVWMGDKIMPTAGLLPQPAWNNPGVIVNQTAVIRQNFLGGPGNGGGLVGTYQWFGGWTDQSFTSPASRIGDAMTPTIPAASIPGHRQQMCVAFSYAPKDSSDPYFNQTYLLQTDPQALTTPVPQGFSLGESPNVNGFAFEVSCYGDKVFSMVSIGFDFGGDADPVECIYDLLTNPWGRLGLDTSKIDMTSFAAASATLKAEGHGYSNVHYQTQDAHDVINEILQQIDAAMHEEPTTGKFVLKLIRNDYTVGALPVFNESNITAVTDYQVGSWRDTVNEVRIKFTDRAGQYNTATVVASSLANAVGNNNRRRPKEIQVPGCSSQKLAAQIAARELGVLSVPLAKVSFTTNRDAWQLRPGSPFVLNYARYNVTGLVCRVTSIDLGKYDKNEITINAVQDMFASNYVGQTSGVPVQDLAPRPLVTRTVIEAPRWILHEAHAQGLINDPDMTRMFALPLPSENAIEFYVNSKQPGPTNGIVPNLILQDVPRQPFPSTMQVAASYSRVLEPYDTTTGMVVNNFVGRGGENTPSFVGRTATFDTISNYGRNFICVMRANGDHEFMAYESVTDLGGGSYRLNNVWRGLLDTPAMDHSVGEYAFFVATSFVGRRAWKITQNVQCQVVPSSGSVSGSSIDTIETFPTIGHQHEYDFAPLVGAATQMARAFRPLPPANFCVFGEGCQGITGTPQVLPGWFKQITLLDEGIDLLGYKRELRQTTIRRGDQSNDTFGTYDGGATTSFRPLVTAVGKMRPQWTGLGIGAGAAGSSFGVELSQFAYSTSQVLYGGSVASVQNIADGQYQIGWYGQIEIGLSARVQITDTNPVIGKGGLDHWIYPPTGFPINNFLDSFAVPSIKAFAPSWRNLIANARFNYALTSTPVAVWAPNGGVPLQASSNFSLSFLSSGPGSYYLIGTTTAYTVRQQLFFGSWFPRGLTAIAIGYIRNAAGDTTHTGTLSLVDDSGATAAGTATIGPLNNWQRVGTQLTIVGTDDVMMTWSANSPNTALTETECRVGTFQSNVLANPSFETGTTSSWTNITNSFVTGTPGFGPSVFYASGGAFATSQIRQEYSLPSGWEIGATAFVTCFRLQTTTGDTGEVRLSAIDGSGAVLTSGTTGVENMTSLSNWQKRTIFCDVPDGTVKIRVDLVANRAGGAGLSTACFDEIILWVAKDQAPRYRKVLDFGTPTTQPMPPTVGDFQLAFPSLPEPDHVFGGGNTFNEKELLWTDQVSHNVGKLTGQFGGVTYQPEVDQTIPSSYGTSSVNAYVFTRGSGSSAVHLAAAHQGYSIGAYPLVQAFSVAVIYTVDEQTYGGRCGLVGRMDLGQGWGLELDSTGHITAVLRGAGGTTITVSTTRTSVEGGRHIGGLVFDPVAATLTVFDEIGSATVSTTGLGEIQGTSAACHLRIGRSADDADVLPGMIARVFLFDAALTSGQFASFWTLGEDPTGLITTYTRSGTVWHTVPSDNSGEVIACAAPAQIAQPWIPALAQNDTFITDGATYPSPPYYQTYKQSGHGLAYGRSSANRITSWDFTNASVWTPDGATTLTQGVVDASGRARGVTVLGNATNGIKVVSVGVGAVARNVSLSFWARGTPGTNNLTVELLTGTAALVTSTTVSLGFPWKRYDVVLAFSGATATCQWRLRSSSGSLTFDLTSVVHSSEMSTTTTMVPALIALPGSSTGDVSVTVATTLPIEFNSEGEILFTGTMLRNPDATLSPAAGTLVQVKNGSNTKNQRELQILAAGTVRLAHTDGAASPATVNSTLATPSSTLTGVVVKARGRWNRLGTLDPNGAFFAQVALADSAHGTITYGGAGRSAAWTNDVTQSTQITLGAGTAPPDPVIATCIIVQAREEKLP